MGSNHGVRVENNEPVRAGQVQALTDQKNALVDQAIEYRILIGEQRDMIRSMFEFTRLLMGQARETLARADQILDWNASRGRNGIAPRKSS